MKSSLASKRIWLVTLFFVILIVAGWLAAISGVGKITDPSDPRFDPSTFSFDDYSNDEILRAALKVTFPIGTHVGLVDQILVESTGATKSTNKPPLDHVVNYTYIPWERVNHTFIFDEEWNLLNIHPYGDRKIYSDTQGFYDLLPSTDTEK